MSSEEQASTETSGARSTSTLSRVERRLKRTLRRLRTGYRRWTRPDVVTHHGVHLPITPAVSEAMRGVLYAGGYEEREYAALTRLLTPADRVLELGTGLGFITVICARACGSSRVTSVEANAGMLATLRETFRQNAVSPELRLAAVSRSGADREFFINQNFWSSSTFDRGGERTIAPGVAFEDLVSQYLPTVIVMDIEGGEVDLVGCRIGASVRAIVIELHLSVTGPEGTRAVREWLEAEGFRASEDWGDRSVVVYERA